MRIPYTIIRRDMRFICLLGKSQWRRLEKKSWWNKTWKDHRWTKWKVRDFPTSDTANLLCILFIAKGKEKEFNLRKNGSARNFNLFLYSHASLALLTKRNCENNWNKLVQNLLTQKSNKAFFFRCRCKWNAKWSKDSSNNE